MSRAGRAAVFPPAAALDPEDLRDRPECPYETCHHNQPEPEEGPAVTAAAMLRDLTEAVRAIAERLFDLEPADPGRNR